MALSEEEKVRRDAEAIARKVDNGVEEGDLFRVFDSDGRNPAQLANAVRTLVGSSWEVTVRGSSIELLHHTVKQEGDR